MLILISYDVSTETKEGRSRLRRIAKECVNHGVRVQNSVFECYIQWGDFLHLKKRLISIMDKQLDSIRFYQIGNKYENKVEHYGAKQTINPEEFLMI